MTSTYTNPVRAHDVPDPDVIRLPEGGYGLVASSFDRRPGLPLWWSADLVDWVPVGFAGGWQPLAQLSGGVWAPALRAHAGRLFITWADPDRGVYVVEAPSLAGPWSAPRLVIEGPGPIDPCPLWDDDGRTWIVHGWARSRAGFANRLDIVEMDAGLTGPVGTSRVAIDGDAIDGCTVLEGPKIYRRAGTYWIFAPAGGVENGWQYAFRADSLDGPWEPRVILEQGASTTNGPHQGAWIEGDAGEEWFMHFQHTPQHGRILHLQPLAWSADGWPLVGHAVHGGPPEPVDEWARPTPQDAPPPPEMRGEWHGRGADPGDLIADAADGRITVHPGGLLARPLGVGEVRVEVSLEDGSGCLVLLGAAEHRVQADAPARLAIALSGDTAHFEVDGERRGEPFALVPSQWTGLEIAVGAGGSETATFTSV
ncbi:glycoside hydrolase 43 family protein [Microbacterium sp.]|uniref:glycoside hydrolase 43 family protein n=1 Tax=Microbacterium sp. TaxID=51671 RepID=UPI003F6FC8AB